MSSVRRALTLALALPLWIVMILTGGQWCLMPGSASAHSVVASAAGVGHASAPEVRAATHAVAAAPHLPPAHHGDSGRPCESQTACSVAVAPATLQLTEAAALAPWQPAGPPPTRPASLVLAPELPPPRA
ncbi:MAG: hypothetical protein ACLGIK_07360 [Gemmatimonadota bacterium]